MLGIAPIFNIARTAPVKVLTIMSLKCVKDIRFLIFAVVAAFGDCYKHSPTNKKIECPQYILAAQSTEKRRKTNPMPLLERQACLG